MKRLLATLIAAATMAAAPTAQAGDMPRVTPTCETQKCPESLILAPTTIGEFLGAYPFDVFVSENGLEGYGLTKDTVVPAGPLKRV